MDDKDDEYDSRIFPPESFPIAMHKICVALNKEKGDCLIRAPSADQDDQDDQDDDLIASIAIKISVLKCNHPKQVHLLKPVCRFVSIFQGNGKSTSHMAFRA